VASSRAAQDVRHMVTGPELILGQAEELRLGGRGDRDPLLDRTLRGRTDQPDRRIGFEVQERPRRFLGPDAQNGPPIVTFMLSERSP
jgi:hypothetical protein